jgi:CDP-glucose 4,6-dehydratase
LIRAPHAVRPWQHVLEALGGYLMIAEALAAGRDSAATGWNFGPADDDMQPVEWVADRLVAGWGSGGWDRGDVPQLHEAGILKLDCSKARSELGWRPVLGLEAALEWIVQWHKAVANGKDACNVTLGQLDQYRTRFSQITTGDH